MSLPHHHFTFLKRRRKPLLSQLSWQSGLSVILSLRRLGFLNYTVHLFLHKRHKCYFLLLELFCWLWFKYTRPQCLTRVWKDHFSQDTWNHLNATFFFCMWTKMLGCGKRNFVTCGLDTFTNDWLWSLILYFISFTVQFSLVLATCDVTLPLLWLFIYTQTIRRTHTHTHLFACIHVFKRCVTPPRFCV